MKTRRRDLSWRDHIKRGKTLPRVLLTSRSANHVPAEERIRGFSLNRNRRGLIVSDVSARPSESDYDVTERVTRPTTWRNNDILIDVK